MRHVRPSCVLIISCLMLACGQGYRTPYLAPAPPERAEREVVAVFTQKTLTIDGKADEPVWGQTQVLRLTHATRGTEIEPKTTVRIAWGEKHLYLFFECEDPDIWGTLTDHDAKLWEEEVVEAFIDADNDRRDYVEFEWSPRNVSFDAWIEAFPTPENLPGFACYEAKGMEHATVIDGTLNQRDDQDRYWTCEVAIPWSAFKETGGARPAVGTAWGMNFFRCDISHQRSSAQSWGPVRGSFHQPSSFGAVVFTK